MTHCAREAPPSSRVSEVKAVEPPKASTVHAVADWLELACLASADGFAGVAELAEERKRQQDTGQADISLGSDLALAVLDEAAGTVDFFGDLTHDDNDYLPKPGDQAARTASPPDTALEDALASLPLPKASGESADVLAHLRARADTLGPARYPFSVEENVLALRNELGAAHGVYIALLICSNLNRVPKTGQSGWTGGFERYSCRALQAFLGTRFIVEVFGTAARPGDMFHGNMKAAIKELVRVTGWQPTRPTELEAELSSSGDRGLDGVAWHDDIGDPADLWPTYFLQAGCGKNWPSKQDEATRARWARLLAISGPIQCVLAIPYWQRETDNRWHASLIFSSENVVLDRLRLIGLAANRDSFRDFPTDRVQAAIVRDADRQKHWIPVTESPPRNRAPKRRGRTQRR